MSDLKQLAALTAINDMLSGNSPSICTIDKVGELLGINPKVAADAYRTLSTLHCISYSKMPPELREAIPGLITDCLGVTPTPQFKAMPAVADILDAPGATSTRRTLMKLLGGS